MERELMTSVRHALDEGDLLIVLGPRVDVEGGHPDLDGLVQAMVKRARELEPGSLPAAEIERLVATGRHGEVFGRIVFIMGREAFRRSVVDLLSTQVLVPPLLSSLARLRDRLRGVYTMSLVDGMFSRAFRGRWPIFDEAHPHLAQRKGLVFHIRGTLGRPNGWVLDEERERRELSRTSARGELLGTVYKAHHLLLMGFDPENAQLERLLDMLPAVEDGMAPEHFIVLSEPCPPAARRRLASRGFEVIACPAQELLDAFAGEPDDGEVAPSGRCPYPGLAAFDEDDAAWFFGRHVELSRAATQLGDDGRGQYHRWLSVEGPSGVGKSSFVLAGVVPALQDGFAIGAPRRWTVARLRPGTHPVRSLLRAILNAFSLDPEARLDELVTRAERDADVLRELVVDHTPPGHGLLLVIDQLEESVTFADESARDRFGELVIAAFEAEPFHLVTTLRSDFVSVLQERLPALGGRLNDRAVRFALPTISRVGLREVVIEPAAREGTAIEPELVEAILADTDRSPGIDEAGEARSSTSALPLIAHVLRLMWDSAQPGQGLTLDAYRKLGGVRGALGRSAEEAVDALGPEAIERVEALLLGLARVDPNSEVTRRPISVNEARSLAGTDELGKRLLARLSGGRDEQEVVQARLIVMDGQGPESSVELVHEALLRDWDRYARLLEANRGQLLIDDELERRARRWDERGRPRKGLPHTEELRELLTGQPHGPMASVQRDYQDALRSAARWRRVVTTARGLWSSVSMVLVVGLLVTTGLQAMSPPLRLPQNDLGTLKATLKEMLEQDRDEQRQALEARRWVPNALKVLRALDEALDEALDALDSLERWIEGVGLVEKHSVEEFMDDVFTMGSEGDTTGRQRHMSYRRPWSIAAAAAAVLEVDSKSQSDEETRKFLVGIYKEGIDAAVAHRAQETKEKSAWPVDDVCRFIAVLNTEQSHCFPYVGEQINEGGHPTFLESLWPEDKCGPWLEGYKHFEPEDVHCAERGPTGLE